MLIKKELLLATINDLPDKFSLDEIMQRIYVIHKIERARSKSKQGKSYTTAEARKKLSKWLK